ncbi:hypothetical protein [Leucothrix arctica]|uniref:hypothetical protein n=1 Tax=Leucothrix arctica TaxID=1481894 RepID=UPI001304C42C|nr:hypothetical protein [Leucothrix arctica]
MFELIYWKKGISQNRNRQLVSMDDPQQIRLDNGLELIFGVFTFDSHHAAV